MRKSIKIILTFLVILIVAVVTLGLYVKKALPNASYVAFTGTPLIAGEERTKDVYRAAG